MGNKNIYERFLWFDHKARAKRSEYEGEEYRLIILGTHPNFYAERKWTGTSSIVQREG